MEVRSKKLEVRSKKIEIRNVTDMIHKSDLHTNIKSYGQTIRYTDGHHTIRRTNEKQTYKLIE